jgi:hypothetical protein
MANKSLKSKDLRRAKQILKEPLPPSGGNSPLQERNATATTVSLTPEQTVVAEGLDFLTCRQPIAKGYHWRQPLRTRGNIDSDGTLVGRVTQHGDLLKKDPWASFRFRC